MADESRDEYPSGPITCCLQCMSKRVRVRDDNSWTVSLILALVSAFLSACLFVVAFGTTGWAQAQTLDDGVVRKIGLWQECRSDTGCQYISAATNIGVMFKLSQALSVLVLLVMIIGVCLTMFYTFMPESPSHSRTGAGAMWCRLIAFILLLTLIPVFATKWWDPKYTTSDKRWLGYSFKMSVVAFCLEFVGAFFMYCDIMVVRPKKPKPLLQESQLVDSYEGSHNEGYLGTGGIYPSDAFMETNDHRMRDRLEDRVFGNVNAKSAFEGYAGNNSTPAQSDFRVSHESLFKSKEDVARRFTGITLAEPEYMSMHGVQRNQNGIPRGRTPQKYSTKKHGLSNGYHASKDSEGVYPHRGEIQRNSEGKLITSVSMYDLHAESQTYSPNRTREMDAASQQSRNVNYKRSEVPRSVANVHPEKTQRGIEKSVATSDHIATNHSLPDYQMRNTAKHLDNKQHVRSPHKSEDNTRLNMQGQHYNQKPNEHYQVNNGYARDRSKSQTYSNTSYNDGRKSQQNPTSQETIDSKQPGPVAPARRLRDKARGNQAPPSLSRAGSTTSLHEDSHSMVSARSVRTTSSKTSAPLSRAQSSSSLHSGHSNHVYINKTTAPAMRVRDRARSTDNLSSYGRMSRANSTTSLHSVVSTATSIVDGCAESEI